MKFYHYHGAWLIGLALLLTSVPDASQAGTKTQALDLARKTLGQRLGLGEREYSTLTPRQATATNWPNTALGCPKPGKFYAQVITPGFRFVFSVQGRNWPVHSGGGRAVICTR